MDKINRSYSLISGVTVNDIQLKFCLYHSFNLSGVMDDLSDISMDTPYTYELFTITGETISRLESLVTYDPINPYVVGINGVTSINNDSNNKLYSVNYTIDGINFTTYTQNNDYTIFSTQVNKIIVSDTNNQDLIKRGFLDGTIATPDVTSNIYMARQEMSVFERHYRIAMMENLDDVTDYGGGGYFEIFDDI